VNNLFEVGGKQRLPRRVKLNFHHRAAFERRQTRPCGQSGEQRHPV